MSRQHPWPHVMGNIFLISITVSEIWDHCQNLLDDPRTIACLQQLFKLNGILSSSIDICHYLLNSLVSLSTHNSGVDPGFLDRGFQNLQGEVGGGGLIC